MPDALPLQSAQPALQMQRAVPAPSDQVDPNVEPLHPDGFDPNSAVPAMEPVHDDGFDPNNATDADGFNPSNAIPAHDFFKQQAIDELNADRSGQGPGLTYSQRVKLNMIAQDNKGAIHRFMDKAAAIPGQMGPAAGQIWKSVQDASGKEIQHYSNEIKNASGLNLAEDVASIPTRYVAGVVGGAAKSIVPAVETLYGASQVLDPQTTIRELFDPQGAQQDEAMANAALDTANRAVNKGTSTAYQAAGVDPNRLDTGIGEQVGQIGALAAVPGGEIEGLAKGIDSTVVRGMSAARKGVALADKAMAASAPAAVKVGTTAGGAALGAMGAGSLGIDHGIVGELVGAAIGLKSGWKNTLADKITTAFTGMTREQVADTADLIMQSPEGQSTVETLQAPLRKQIDHLNDQTIALRQTMKPEELYNLDDVAPSTGEPMWPDGHPKLSKDANIVRQNEAQVADLQSKIATLQKSAKVNQIINDGVRYLGNQAATMGVAAGTGAGFAGGSTPPEDTSQMGAGAVFGLALSGGPLGAHFATKSGMLGNWLDKNSAELISKGAQAQITPDNPLYPKYAEAMSSLPQEARDMILKNQGLMAHSGQKIVVLKPEDLAAKLGTEGAVPNGYYSPQDSTAYLNSEALGSNVSGHETGHMPSIDPQMAKAVGRAHTAAQSAYGQALNNLMQSQDPDTQARMQKAVDAYRKLILYSVPHQEGPNGFVFQGSPVSESPQLVRGEPKNYVEASPSRGPSSIKTSREVGIEAPHTELSDSDLRSEVTASLAADLFRKYPPEALYGVNGQQLIRHWINGLGNAKISETSLAGFPVTPEMQKSMKDVLFDVGTRATEPMAPNGNVNPMIQSVDQVLGGVKGAEGQSKQAGGATASANGPLGSTNVQPNVSEKPLSGAAVPEGPKSKLAGAGVEKSSESPAISPEAYEQPPVFQKPVSPHPSEIKAAEERNQRNMGISKEKAFQIHKDIEAGKIQGPEDMPKFMPSTRPDAIKEAAVEWPDGSVTSGSNHGEAYLKKFPNTEAGSAPVVRGYKEGYVDNSGKFYNRKDAETQAVKIGQLNENQLNIGVDSGDFKNKVSDKERSDLADKIKQGIEEPIHQDMPIKWLTVSKKGIDQASLESGKRTKGPVGVFYDTDKDQFLVSDGYHRVSDAMRRGDKTIPAEITGGYNDYYANPNDAIKFMPSDDPRAIARTAIRRDSDGKVFTGSNPRTPHWMIPNENKEASMANTAGEHGKWTDGWETNDKEFLDKDQGHARATEIGQLPKNAKTEYDGALSSLDSRQMQLMPASEKAKQSAEDYVNKSGIGRIVQPSTAKVDVERAKQIAKDYEALPKNDGSPETRQSYKTFVDEVNAQFQHAKDSGIKFEFTNNDPYKSSEEMLQDVEKNGRLKVFTGGDDHPFLGNTTKDADGLTANDKFRAVHDLYGHASEGNQFGPQGEERAWQKHAAMFSDEARPAMTAETRGQNSWVNYGPHMFDENGWRGDKSHPGHIPPAMRPFAEQKASLLPSEHSELPDIPSGAVGSGVRDALAEIMKRNAPDQKFMPSFKLKPEDEGMHPEDPRVGFNMWLSPDGKFYKVGDHRQWAKDRTTLNEGEKAPRERDPYRTGGTREAVGWQEQALKDKGWIRISRERETNHEAYFLNGRNPTSKQASALEIFKSQNPDAELMATGGLDDRFGSMRFMPSPHPEAIDKPAVRFPDGKVYTGFMHAAAWAKGTENYTPEQLGKWAKEYGHSHPEEAGNYAESGYVNNKGDFVNSKDALAAAIKHGQVTEQAIKDARNAWGLKEDQAANKPIDHLESMDFESARKDKGLGNAKLMPYDNGTFRDYTPEEVADMKKAKRPTEAALWDNMSPEQRKVERPELNPNKRWFEQRAYRVRPQQFMPSEPFYSQLQRTIEAQPDKANPDQLRAAIMKGPGVKQAELRETKDLLGNSFEQYLKDNPQATKQDMLNFVNENKVKIGEVNKGASQPLDGTLYNRYEELGRNLAERTPAERAEYQKLHEQIGDYLENRDNNKPKFDREDLNLPGARERSYGETSVTVPSQPDFVRYPMKSKVEYNPKWERWDVTTGDDPVPRYASPNEADARAKAKEYETQGVELENKNKGKQWEGPHTEVPNEILHIRHDLRDLPDGKTGFMLQELQSDLHAKGRKEGYRTGDSALGWTAKPNYDNTRWLTIKPDGTQGPSLDSSIFKTPQEAIESVTSKLNSVPDLPFKGNAWKTLGMKVALKKAIESGADELMWTTGKQQQDRYDLGKHIDHVIATPGPLPNDAWSIRAVDHGGNNVIDRAYLTSELPDVVGKDLAAKIINQEGDRVSPSSGSPRARLYSGNNLKVGGEWANNLYDKEMVNIANDLGKKYGARVGQRNISDQQPYTTGHAARLETLAADPPNRGLRYQIVDKATGKPLETFDQSVDSWHAGGVDPDQTHARARNALDKYGEIKTPETMVHSLPITSEMKQSIQEKGQPLFMPADYEHIQKSLIDDEKNIRPIDIPKVVSAFNKIPDVKHGAELAMIGSSKKDWYRDSVNSINQLFGHDSDRFSALLASLSPQIGLAKNLENSLRVWNAWEDEGRPTDKDTIARLVAENATLNKPESGQMTAWVNNAHRTLSADDASPSSLQISGAKVNSFYRNLRGDVNELTNDTHMAHYATGDWKSANIFGSSPRYTKDKIGIKGFQYIAMNAHMRQVADYLTNITGEKWTPPEVQAAIWSYQKTISEMADKKGVTPDELMSGMSKENIQKSIASSPDFAKLLSHPNNENQIRKIQDLKSATIRNRESGAAPTRSSQGGPSLQGARLPTFSLAGADPF